MSVFDRLKSLYQTDITSVRVDADTEGLGVTFDPKEWDLVSSGQGSRLAQHQYVLVQILLEQGIGEPIHCGIHLPSSEVTALDFETRETLMLPDPWPWQMRLETDGLTYQPGFQANLILIDGANRRIPRYQTQGPLISLSDQEKYLPNETQWRALSAIQRFDSIPIDARSETDNLKLIYELLASRSLDDRIDVEGFSDLDVVKPERVGVAIDEDADGGLHLSPVLGEGMHTDDVRGSLGQISGDKATGSLRVGKRIAILDEDRMTAIREIISSSYIPSNDRQAFFENPTAWLDASLVDLDLGFSFRVRGAGPFRHAYFGETDEAGISWFQSKLVAEGAREKPERKIVGPDELGHLIRNRSDLEQLENRLNDAIAAGADHVPIRGFDLSIEDLAKIRATIAGLSASLEDQESIDEDPEAGPSEPTVIDIETYDEDTETQRRVEAPKINYTSSRVVDYSSYARTPFPHQQTGISWLLGLAEDTWCSGLDQLPHRGALLADDMGLGKTFMSLVFAKEFLETQASHGPVLIVAPLVLLENWRREIEATYNEPFFEKVVILQAEADLPKFRVAGAKSELTMNRGIAERSPTQEPELNAGVHAVKDELLTTIKYALKIGGEFGSNRLDLPKSVVLTTYQTLRDYQFSLARVDWSIAIFDEAQNIKNPNAIQTRAAKALKAKFKLVMTGTPVENHLGDFWCLFDTLQPGFLGAYQEFRTNYIKPILGAAPEEVAQTRVKVGQELRDAAGGFMLRRAKEDHLDGLPEKRLVLGAMSESGAWVFEPSISRVMEGDQLERYQSVVNATVELMQEEGGRGQALGGLQRLRQVSLHPDLLEGGHPGIPASEAEARKIFSRSGKLKILIELLTEIRERDEKAIIFLIDKKLQQTIAIGIRQIFQCKASIINGDTKTFSKRSQNKTRQGIIDEFEATPGFEVLIMSPVAAGVGLTITSANNVIHLERHWNPAKESQATDRVYRIGQTKDVNVYFPILLHPEVESFDVNLNRLLSSKQGLKDAVMVPDEVSPDEMITSGVFGEKFESTESSLTITDVDRLNWDMFEALIATIYAKQGFETILTSKGRDKGADVVVLEGDSGCILVQAKHTERLDRFDGYSAISEVYGAGPHYSSTLGRAVSGHKVFSNAARFSDEAVRHAKTYNVELAARKDLEQLLKRTNITHGDLIRRNQMRIKL